MYSEAGYKALYEDTASSGIAISPLIINACLIGSVLNRDSAPHVPVSTAFNN